MQQFIQMASSALGASEQTARTVTGGLLDLIAKSAPHEDVSALLSRLPGAADLLNSFQSAACEAPIPAASDASLLGSLSNAAAAVLDVGSPALGGGTNPLGPGAASLSTLASTFAQENLDTSRLPQFIAMFAQWAGRHAGQDVVQRAIGAIPGA